MDWISVKDKVPELPCVVWDGHNYPKTPIGILEAKTENGEVYYFDDGEEIEFFRYPESPSSKSKGYAFYVNKDGIEKLLEPDEVSNN